jgi:hypothetical protein
MQIIRDTVTLAELQKLAAGMFGDLVKAVVDVERKIMAIGGELHADEEALLLEDCSEQANLWGINLYPAVTDANFIEFDSMINLRPGQNNRTRGVDNPEIQKLIIEIVNKLVKR